jgi:hypothetical protein
MVFYIYLIRVKFFLLVGMRVAFIYFMTKNQFDCQSQIFHYEYVRSEVISMFHNEI